MMRVHCLVLKNNPNYVNFFYADDIQLQIQVAPPGLNPICLRWVVCFALDNNVFHFNPNNNTLTKKREIISGLLSFHSLICCILS